MGMLSYPRDLLAGPRRCALSAALIAMYRFRPLRPLCARMSLHWEGGQFFSLTMRDILRIYYNKDLGFVEHDSVAPGSLTIEHDAWIGARAILTPGSHRVGVGAVIGAGAVVTRDVPVFAIVAGNPAKLIRYRFPEKTCEAINASRWWERSFPECRQYMDAMTCALGEDVTWHPLLTRMGGLDVASWTGG